MEKEIPLHGFADDRGGGSKISQFWEVPDWGGGTEQSGTQDYYYYYYYTLVFLQLRWFKNDASTWSKIFSHLSSLEWATPICRHLARELPSCSFSRLAFFSVGIHVDLNPGSITTDESSSPAEKEKDRHIKTFLPSILLAELGFSVFSHFYIPLVAGKTEKRFFFL